MNDRSTTPYLIGFAGHRNVPDREALSKVIRQKMEEIRTIFGARVTALCSAAAGADLVFLKVCVEMRIPAIIILPFERERFSKDFEDPQEWHLANSLLSVALAAYRIKGNAKEPEAYQIVSHQLLEWADAFLFVWDGEKPRGVGGTAETVADAMAMGIPSCIVNAKNYEAKWTFTPDAKRGARNGFESKKELLEFLDERLLGDISNQ